METQTIYDLINLGIPVIAGAVGYFAGRRVWKDRARSILRDLDEAVKIGYSGKNKNSRDISVQVLSDIEKRTAKDFRYSLRFVRYVREELKGSNE